MKLLRYGERGKEIPAMLDEAGHIRDLSAYVHDFYGEAVSTKTLKRLQSLDTDSLPTLPKGERIGACLRDIPTFFRYWFELSRSCEGNGVSHPARAFVVFQSNHMY